MRASPLRRRLVAALLLVVFAIGSVLLWNDGRVDWSDLAINLFAAACGLLVLHYRWRRQERRAMTPRKLKDIFS